jgi:hypothetical protein
MRKMGVLAVMAVLVGGVGIRAEDTPKMPVPQKEHEWLKQLEGEWETEVTMFLAPGQPPVKNKGTESVRSIGAFWSVAEHKGEFMGAPFCGVMTVGYDAQKKKYVGTWVCSMCDLLWQYEGTVNGQVLTLNTEGPCCMSGKVVKMKDVIEIKDRDHKVMTSYMLGEDGKWVTVMTLHSTRKK